MAEGNRLPSLDNAPNLKTDGSFLKPTFNRWYLLWITWLDETYWVIGATLGGLIGPFLNFDLKGLDFVLTAMFTAIFADNWLREKDHTSSISGLIISGLCLTIFSVDPPGGLLPSPHPFLLCRFRSTGGCRNLHHSHPCMEKEYDVIDSSRHPLLYAAHQNSTLLIPTNPSHTYIT